VLKVVEKLPQVLVAAVAYADFVHPKAVMNGQNIPNLFFAFMFGNMDRRPTSGVEAS